MRLDGYSARQSLIGLSVHCANSYIPQHIRIMCCTLYVYGHSQHMDSTGAYSTYPFATSDRTLGLHLPKRYLKEREKCMQLNSK